MKRRLLIITLILLFISKCCYCAKIQCIIGKWLYISDSGELKLNIIGFDTEGYKRERHKILSKEGYFPNGFIYSYHSYRGTCFYGCQLIHKKHGKYYVVGFATFENDAGVTEEIKMEPVLLFDWGFDISTQKIYCIIDVGKCPEISEEYIKPFSWKRVQEQYIYDELNGNIPSESSQNTEQESETGEYRKVFEINQSE